MKLYKVYTKEKGIVETDNYSKISYLTLHRENGPAVICYYDNGNVSYEDYFINDKKHRLDGPATITYYDNGTIRYEYYYIKGVCYSKENYYKELLKCKINLL